MIELTPEETAFRETVARFVDREVVPVAAALDERGEFPLDLFRRIGSLGWLGLRYPESAGGAGAGFMAYLLLVEELARGSMSVASVVAMQGMMATDFPFRYGTPDHRVRLLAPALAGEKIGAFCLTEPGAGSDLARIETTATQGPTGWVLKGPKAWVTNGTRADFFTVAASIDRSKGLKGLRFFLVERDAPGLHVGRRTRTLGLWAGEVTELSLDGCPATPLGEGGANDLLRMLDQIRTMTGALSLGLMRSALAEAAAYARQRVCFQRPIAEFQAVQHHLARVATDLEASRLLVWQAGRRVERGLPCGREAAAAKLFASEAANRAADMATRVLASAGFAMESGAQRLFRDARFLLIGGGTSEILLNAIARDVLAT